MALKQSRVATLDGAPWFVAADVCRVLGMPFGHGQGSTGKHLKALAPDEKRTINRATLGPNRSALMGERGMSVFTAISEPGLFRLIMRSDKPIARPFRDWLTRMVLPAIRKDHGYNIAGEEKGARSVDQT
ncbi:BRO-N domain-containing protein [Rhodoplanes serenus]|uniref:BRO-N domain-containing protein n=1 Tax=Rhodoplanes serenus TaxID=200615 RepID=UPI000DAB3ECE|nr:BRO family protein [Rhodoplanes serenus]RAI33882.1 hypothetical protein CH340_10820 [Rhodoplanes serenus]